MANNRMTWTELRRNVARQAGVEEAKADRFLTALAELIEERVKDNDTVNIKGIGTFSSRMMEERESVDVTTSEKIVIPGYRKVVIMPENSFQGQIKKRMTSSTNPTEADDQRPSAIEKLSQQAEEIVDLLSDLGQLSNSNAEPAEEPIAESVAELVSEPVAEPHDEPIPEVPTHKAEPTILTGPIPKTTKSTRTKHKHHGWVWVLLIIAIAAGLAYYYQEPLMRWASAGIEYVKGFIQSYIPTQEEPAPAVIDTIVVIEPTDTVSQPMALRDMPREYTRYIAVEYIPYGSRLAWLSYKYYGTKDLWVFIYEANRDSIEHPNLVWEKQKICIPELDEKLTDLNDPELRQLLEELANQYQHR